MNSRITLTLFLRFSLAALPVPGTVSAGGEWPEWRGDGSGTSGDTNLPVFWDGTNNVAWRTPLPGEGSSSPIVWKKRAFVTASDDGGKKRLVLCLDAETGKILWRRELVSERVPKTDPKSGYAPATPATDGRRVFAFFDSPGLVALDMDGKVLWTLPLGPFDSPYNVAGSPILYRDSVILCCDHSGDAFILAAGQEDGKVRWRTPRKLGIQFSTPILIEYQGRPQVVVNASAVKSYDPETGAELWTCAGMMPTVAPSAVYDGALVYATSGRNGPAMAIDPGGRGDVKESHVRMQVPTGGPYVPSPLACSGVALPGDDGALRFVDRQGNVVLTHRVKGHFTASPILAGSRVYWTSESGETYVVDVSRLNAVPPEVKTLARNPLEGRCLASPAVRGEGLFIRTSWGLFCISGGARPAEGSGAPASAAGASSAELKKQYDEHPAPDGADIPIRLSVVEECGARKEPAAIDFLKTAALKDPHWDVSEAAAKALTGYADRAAVPALIEVFADGRPYLKIIAAQGLGRLGAAEALPLLQKGAQGGDALLRIACLEALAGLLRAGGAGSDAVVPALLAGAQDPEVTVRAASVRCSAGVAEQSGDARPRLVEAVLRSAADASPLVRESALGALKALGVPEETIMRNVQSGLLYGEAREEPVVAQLTAGPIRLKFQDGELRYLYVGGREIVRRIYFAVRDQRFDTIMPRFTRMEVKPSGDGFTVQLEAVSQAETADYSWKGDITGTPDGKIVFRAEGKANRAFPSPRIGINVLFGTESLAGQVLEVTDKDGRAKKTAFPREVAAGLIADVNTTGLKYRTAEGVEVACRFTGQGCGVEDQRNFCDTSYKAFHTLGYPRDVPPGEMRSDTLTLEVANAGPAGVQVGPVVVAVGRAQKGLRMPRIVPGADPGEKTESFVAMNGKRDSLRSATSLAWAFNPAAHMPDEDMFMENVPAIVDQVRTVRGFAPDLAAIRIAPVSFDSPYPRPRRDPRNRGLFGAAWSAAMAGYLAQAGVSEAAIAVGPGPASVVQDELARCSGCPLLAVSLSGPLPLAVYAFGVQQDKTRILWMVNRTERPQPVVVEKLRKATALLVNRLNATTLLLKGPAESLAATSRAGSLDLTMEPYEVCRLVLDAR